MSKHQDNRQENQADKPAPTRRITSSECHSGDHRHCSRNPHKMPSWPILAVCECECHDAVRRMGGDAA